MEAFSKVYELRSFSKAAGELFLSQPSVSAHISSLEAELDISLFDRLGRTVLPTQAADVLYDNARDIFSLMSKAKAEIDILKERVSGKLHIGGSTIPANYLLPGLLTSFRHKFQNITINLDVGDTDQIIEKVGNGTLSLGIVGAEVTRGDLTCEKFISDDLVIIAPQSMDVDGPPVRGAEMISEWPWIVREKGSGTRKAFEAGLEKLGLGIKDLNVAIQVENTGVVLECVKLGMGVSVTSLLAASSHIERNEVKVVESPAIPMHRDFYLIQHKGRYVLPVVRGFIEHIKAQAVTSVATSSLSL